MLFNSMEKKYLLPFILLILLLGTKIPSFSSVENVQIQDVQISVQVSGAVRYPGIYEMEAGSCVSDVLNQAELLEEADTSAMNLLITLRDKDTVYVPYQKEGVERISINSASKEELMGLPGIGEVISQRILDYRNSHGLFQTLEDLKKVKGIGEKTFEKIREMIRL